MKSAYVLKLKLQYFDHLLRRVDSLEETLMLRGIGGRRRRGRRFQRGQSGRAARGTCPAPVLFLPALNSLQLRARDGKLRELGLKCLSGQAGHGSSVVSRLFATPLTGLHVSLRASRGPHVPPGNAAAFDVAVGVCTLASEPPEPADLQRRPVEGKGQLF